MHYNKEGFDKCLTFDKCLVTFDECLIRLMNERAKRKDR